MESATLLGKEWQTLQDNHEDHERNALFIKLASLALCATGLATGLALFWITSTVLICWLQEGIFKTYQSRLADRLLSIERLLVLPNEASPAMQLHSAWRASRPVGSTLFGSYLISAVRPTVAFPYLPTLLLLGFGRWLSWL